MATPQRRQRAATILHFQILNKMNSYCKAITTELRHLQAIGAPISNERIERAAKGAWEVGLGVQDQLKGKRTFDLSRLKYLSNQASREEFPDYWKIVDAAGGRSETDTAQNAKVFFAVLNSLSRSATAE